MKSKLILGVYKILLLCAAVDRIFSRPTEIVEVQVAGGIVNHPKPLNELEQVDATKGLSSDAKLAKKTETTPAKPTVKESDTKEITQVLSPDPEEKKKITINHQEKADKTIREKLWLFVQWPWNSIKKVWILIRKSWSRKVGDEGEATSQTENSKHFAQSQKTIENQAEKTKQPNQKETKHETSNVSKDKTADSAPQKSPEAPGGAKSTNSNSRLVDETPRRGVMTVLKSTWNRLTNVISSPFSNRLSKTDGTVSNKGEAISQTENSEHSVQAQATEATQGRGEIKGGSTTNAVDATGKENPK